VTVRSPGKGKITINGQPITYFDYIQAREQVSESSANFQPATIVNE
jgi:hypothetical protein